LPVTSTLTLGHSFEVINNSSGVVTVQSSGTNALQAMAASSVLRVKCIAITGTGTASWTWEYVPWTSTPPTWATDSYTDNTVGAVCKDTSGVIKKCTLVGVVASGTTTPTITGIGGTLGATANSLTKRGADANTAAMSGIYEDGTTVDFSALNLISTGSIQGKINIITNDITLSATQVLGSVIVMSGGAETATLPAAVVGMNVLFYASAAGVKNIDPNGTDTIVLTTAALTAGYQIESPGAVGDFIALVCLATNQWTAMGRSGTWVTHGAD
jgi:hypothetical protein